MNRFSESRRVDIFISSSSSSVIIIVIIVIIINKIIRRKLITIIKCVQPTWTWENQTSPVSSGSCAS